MSNLRTVYRTSKAEQSTGHRISTATKKVERFDYTKHTAADRCREKLQRSGGSSTRRPRLTLQPAEAEKPPRRRQPGARRPRNTRNGSGSSSSMGLGRKVREENRARSNVFVQRSSTSKSNMCCCTA